MNCFRNVHGWPHVAIAALQCHIIYRTSVWKLKKGEESGTLIVPLAVNVHRPVYQFLF